MKFRKGFGGFLLGIGCITLFIGAAAAVLPFIQNEQLTRVLQTFSVPNDNAFVSTVNAVMNYALRNCYLVMLFGAVAALLGALTMLSGHPKKAEPVKAVIPDAPASPYAVQADDRPQEPVTTWRDGGREPVRESNPFADTSVSRMLTPPMKSERPASLQTNFTPIVPLDTADEPPITAQAPVPLSESVHRTPEGVSAAQTKNPIEAIDAVFHADAPVGASYQPETVPMDMPDAPQAEWRPAIREIPAPSDVAMNAAMPAEPAVRAAEVPKPVPVPVNASRTSETKSRIRSTMGRHTIPR